MITTIYASADGTAYGENSAYATARTTAAASLTSSLVVGQTLAGSTYRCYEAFLQFNCSALGSYGKFTITDVDLFLKVQDDLDAVSFDLNVVGRNYGSTFEQADYVSGAGITGTVKFQDASSAFADEVYRQLTQASAWDSAALINYSGSSSAIMYMAYSSRHAAGTTPAGNECLTFYSSAAAGTTSDPYALVEWYSKEPVAGYLHGAVGPAAAWQRVLSAEEIAQVVALGGTIIDRVLDSGVAVIEGEVDTAAGTKVPAARVRAGWWLQNLDYQPEASDKPRPLLITGNDVSLANGRNALTVGVDWVEKEIGVSMARTLALPEPVEVSAAEASAADPYQPESTVTEETGAADDGPLPTYWDGYPTEEAYLRAHPWMR